MADRQILCDFISCDRKDSVQIVSVLESLEIFIENGIIRESNAYMISKEEGNDIVTDYSNKSRHMDSFHRAATNWLTSVISNPPHDLDEHQNDALVDRISMLISQMCGKSANGGALSVFQFNFINCGALKIRETSYSEAALGFQTWGSGIILANMIDCVDGSMKEGPIGLNVKGQNVLEFGCGTGLAGLICGRKGAASTYMTDYHPAVLQNAIDNIKSNEISNVHVRKLDWNEPTVDLELGSIDFKIILAADCVFDVKHCTLLPKVAKKYISKSKDARFHVIVACRLQFAVEVKHFFETMLSDGWILESEELIQRNTIDFRYHIYLATIEIK